MSEAKTTAATRRNGSLVIRGAEPADHEAIGGPDVYEPGPLIASDTQP